jgi:pimeloyl-ACP methyl ester carboxylesterase
MDVVLQPRLEGVYRLGDRRIGFAEYGCANGRVVFWFHGTPGGSRQIAPLARTTAQRLGVRLIALERPGIGASTPHLYPDLGGWAADVGEIADRLGIDRFACVGLSGGGPYVLACAARDPERMVAGAILGGVAPTVGPEAIGGGLVGLIHPVAPVLERIHSLAARALHPVVRLVMPLRSSIFDVYIALSPPGDQLVFCQPEMKAMFLDDIVHGTRRWAHAPLLDLVLFNRDWGFSLGDVRVPIRLWQGDADNIVPLAHAQHLASLLPDVELRTRPNESHLGSLAAAEEIFDTVLQLWPGPQPNLLHNERRHAEGLIADHRITSPKMKACHGTRD